MDGKSVITCTNHEAVELLRNTGTIVTLVLERYLRGPKYEQLQLAIRANELRLPSPPSISAASLPKIPLSLVVCDYDIFLRWIYTNSTVKIDAKLRTKKLLLLFFFSSYDCVKVLTR